MSMSLSEIKLEMYRQRYGNLSAEEAMMLAIEAEKWCRDLGPFDMAYSKFSQDMTSLENFAYLLQEAKQ